MEIRIPATRYSTLSLSNWEMLFELISACKYFYGGLCLNKHQGQLMVNAMDIPEIIICSAIMSRRSGPVTSMVPIYDIWWKKFTEPTVNNRYHALFISTFDRQQNRREQRRQGSYDADTVVFSAVMKIAPIWVCIRRFGTGWWHVATRDGLVSWNLAHEEERQMLRGDAQFKVSKTLLTSI